jgi:hypothetical protein
MFLMYMSILPKETQVNTIMRLLIRRGFSHILWSIVLDNPPLFLYVQPILK